MEIENSSAIPFGVKTLKVDANCPFGKDQHPVDVEASCVLSREQRKSAVLIPRFKAITLPIAIGTAGSVC